MAGVVGTGTKRLVCLWLWEAQKLVCVSYGGPKISVLEVCMGCAKRLHQSIPPRLARALLDSCLPVERKL